jgi:hypothetical protein
MTGMPAWGVTHEDGPALGRGGVRPQAAGLTPEQYEALVKNAPKHEELMHEMEMGGEHEHNRERE